MPFQEAFLFPLTNILNRLNILEKSPYFCAHLHTLYILYVCKHAIKLFKYANTTAITWFQETVWKIILTLKASWGRIQLIFFHIPVLLEPLFSFKHLLLLCVWHKQIKALKYYTMKHFCDRRGFCWTEEQPKAHWPELLFILILLDLYSKKGVSFFCFL